MQLLPLPKAVVKRTWSDTAGPLVTIEGIQLEVPSALAHSLTDTLPLNTTALAPNQPLQVKLLLKDGWQGSINGGALVSGVALTSGPRSDVYDYVELTTPQQVGAAKALILQATVQPDKPLNHSSIRAHFDRIV
jgi:hypothetical protein